MRTRLYCILLYWHTNTHTAHCAPAGFVPQPYRTGGRQLSIFWAPGGHWVIHLNHQTGTISPSSYALQFPRPLIPHFLSGGQKGRTRITLPTVSVCLLLTSWEHSAECPRTSLKSTACFLNPHLRLLLYNTFEDTSVTCRRAACVNGGRGRGVCAKHP